MHTYLPAALTVELGSMGKAQLSVDNLADVAGTASITGKPERCICFAFQVLGRPSLFTLHFCISTNATLERENAAAGGIS
jgi:hypothetical protein